MPPATAPSAPRGAMICSHVGRAAPRREPPRHSRRLQAKPGLLRRMADGSMCDAPRGDACRHPDARRASAGCERQTSRHLQAMPGIMVMHRLQTGQRAGENGVGHRGRPHLRSTAPPSCLHRRPIGGDSRISLLPSLRHLRPTEPKRRQSEAAALHHKSATTAYRDEPIITSDELIADGCFLRPRHG